MNPSFTDPYNYTLCTLPTLEAVGNSRNILNAAILGHSIRLARKWVWFSTDCPCSIMSVKDERVQDTIDWFADRSNVCGAHWTTQTNETHVSVANLGSGNRLRLIWLSLDDSDDLLPKTAFKISQKFPTASLDIILKWTAHCQCSNSKQT